MLAKEVASLIEEMLLVREGQVITKAIARERANNIAMALPLGFGDSIPESLMSESVASRITRQLLVSYLVPRGWLISWDPSDGVWVAQKRDAKEKPLCLVSLPCNDCEQGYGARVLDAIAKIAAADGCRRGDIIAGLLLKAWSQMA